MQSPRSQTNVQGAPSCHAPSAPHACGTSTEHCLSPSLHVPLQLPSTQANAHSVSVLVTRSAPHSINLLPAQNLSPGFLPMQNGTGSWQEPWLTPGEVSHSKFPEQTVATAHSIFVGSQTSASFCACAAHASSLGLQQGWPIEPTPAPPASQSRTSVDASASAATSLSSPASPDSPALPAVPPVPSASADASDPPADVSATEASRPSSYESS